MVSLHILRTKRLTFPREICPPYLWNLSLVPTVSLSNYVRAVCLLDDLSSQHSRVWMELGRTRICCWRSVRSVSGGILVWKTLLSLCFIPISCAIYSKKHIFEPVGMDTSFYLSPELRRRAVNLAFREKDGSLSQWNNQVDIIEQDPTKRRYDSGTQRTPWWIDPHFQSAFTWEE